MIRFEIKDEETTNEEAGDGSEVFNVSLTELETEGSLWQSKRIRMEAKVDFAQLLRHLSQTPVIGAIKKRKRSIEVAGFVCAYLRLQEWAILYITW